MPILETIKLRLRAIELPDRSEKPGHGPSEQLTPCALVPGAPLARIPRQEGLFVLSASSVLDGLVLASGELLDEPRPEDSFVTQEPSPCSCTLCVVEDFSPPWKPCARLPSFPS